MGETSLGVSFLVLGLLVVIYFVPFMVAKMRKHSKATAIGVLNLFLGWTGLGWIGALVWSFTENNVSK